MRHDQYYRDCSASEYDDEPAADRVVGLLSFAAWLVAMLVVLAI